MDASGSEGLMAMRKMSKKCQLSWPVLSSGSDIFITRYTGQEKGSSASWVMEWKENVKSDVKNAAWWCKGFRADSGMEKKQSAAVLMARTGGGMEK